VITDRATDITARIYSERIVAAFAEWPNHDNNLAVSSWWVEVVFDVGGDIKKYERNANKGNAGNE
jgi:hypothetical protein